MCPSLHGYHLQLCRFVPLLVGYVITLLLPRQAGGQIGDGPIAVVQIAERSPALDLPVMARAPHATADPELAQQVVCPVAGSRHPGTDPPPSRATMSSSYWSSTSFGSSPVIAWFVFFSDGIVGTSGKSGNFFVRAVRGGL